MCYKKKKSLFAWRCEKWPNFTFKAYSQYDHRLFLSIEMGNIRSCKKARLEKSIKIYVFKIVFVLVFLQLRKFFPSPFMQDVLKETQNICFKNSWISYLLLCHFFMSCSLEDWNYIKNYNKQIMHSFLFIIRNYSP